MKCKVARGEFSHSRRVLAVSDIHGRPDLLRRLLQKLDYQSGRDGLVLVGDLLEKGPDSLGVLHMAMELDSQPRVYVLRGNCDGILLEEDDPDLAPWLAGRQEGFIWQLCALEGIGREEALADVPAALRRLQDAYPAEAAFLKALPDILETEEYRFAHAGLAAGPLEEQEREFVLAVPAYLDSAPKSEKLLVVGHYGACNYAGARRGVCDCAPLYDAEKNILAIDGGLQIKEGGQLNGAELWGGAYRRFACVDGLPRALVTKSQKQSEGSVAWMWPDFAVEVLEQGESEALCRHPASGQTARVPLELLIQRDGKTRLAGDYTDLALGVKAGERVGVVRRLGGQVLAKKHSVQGWVPAENLAVSEDM